MTLNSIYFVEQTFELEFRSDSQSNDNAFVAVSIFT